MHWFRRLSLGMAVLALGAVTDACGRSDRGQEARVERARQTPEPAPAATPPQAPAREEPTGVTPDAGAAAAAGQPPSSRLAAQGAPEAPSQAAVASRPRSPLERSPGYYPPPDPESLSVARGKRDAKPVDMEISGGATSEKGLVHMLLVGLRAKDAQALQVLRVTRHEFATIFWPEFPQSRPVTNITADDAWEFQIAQNGSGVNRAIGNVGGRELELVQVEHDAFVEYTNFKMCSNVRITVRDVVTGEVSVLRFAPSFVERHGRWKVLVYKD